MFRVPKFVLRDPIFGHLMVGVRRNEEDRGTVPGTRSLLLLPLNPGSFLATVLISEAANMYHCLSTRVVLNSDHESSVKFDSIPTQTSRVRVQSAVNIKVMSRVGVESR